MSGFFRAFDFCLFCVVIRFSSSPPKRPMTPDFEGFLYQILSITLFSYLISWERASVSLFNVECKTSELLVPFLLSLWYDAVLDWGLNPGPPVLEASTLPLGYRGGGVFETKINIKTVSFQKYHTLKVFLWINMEPLLLQKRQDPHSLATA